MVLAFHLVGNYIDGRIGNGKSLRLGEDPWEGAGEDYKLSESVLTQLKAQRIHKLVDVQAQHPQQKGRAGWKDAQELRLGGEDAEEWSKYVKNWL